MRRTPAGAAFTELILELFRLNGCVLAEGDRLTAPEGLSSARWQVMGAIDEGPQTVSGIARRMGLTRQSVQRTVNELARSGIVKMLENPDHKRAKLIDLTVAGRAALDAVTVRQGGWANVAADGIAPARLADAVGLLRELRQQLGGWAFLGEPWLAGMVALFLFEFIEGNTVTRLYFLRLRRLTRQALAQGRVTAELERARGERVPTFTHFLDLPILFLIIALGVTRPTDWTMFFAGSAVALTAAALLTAVLPRLYPWGPAGRDGKVGAA